MKFYAHQGRANDNAFTTKDGCPVRKFKVFNTKMERKKYQETIWRQTGGRENVIFCTRKFLQKYFPDFCTDGIEVYSSIEAYLYSKEF